MPHTGGGTSTDLFEKRLGGLIGDWLFNNDGAALSLFIDVRRG